MDAETALFLKVFEAIQQAKRILLVADGSPDGDSLGSSSAMLNWLIREGKDCAVFCITPIPRTFTYLDNIQRYTNDPKTFDQVYDLIMTFDTGSLRRCGIDQLLPKMPKGYVLINIDHHATNEKFGHINALFTDASSTAEVVYRFFEANNIKLDPAAATSILSGIWTDTSYFTNSATTKKSLEAAGQCFAAGARFSDIMKYMVKNKTLPMLKLLGIALAHLQKNEKYNVVSTYFLLRDLEGTPRADDAMEWIVNYLSGVCADADTIMVLRETPEGKVKGSFRSIARDVSEVAKLLGGGGHKKAAGFAINGKLQVGGGKVRIESI